MTTKERALARTSTRRAVAPSGVDDDRSTAPPADERDLGLERRRNVDATRDAGQPYEPGLLELRCELHRCFDRQSGLSDPSGTHEGHEARLATLLLESLQFVAPADEDVGGAPNLTRTSGSGDDANRGDRRRHVGLPDRIDGLAPSESAKFVLAQVVDVRTGRDRVDDEVVCRARAHDLATNGESTNRAARFSVPP